MDYVDKTRQKMQRIMKYYDIPAHMHESVIRYVIRGDHSGGFLTSVVRNDLFKAVGKADADNVARLPSYVKYFYNAAPNGCWDSPETVVEWCDGGGLVGIYKEQEHNETAVAQRIEDWLDRTLRRLFGGEE